MALSSFTRKALTHLPSLSSPSPPLYLLLLRLSSSYFAASSTPFSNSAQSTFHRRQQGDESRSVRVSVLWDFENCPVPAGANVFKVGYFITSAVRGCGIKGPVHITAFGDVRHLSRTHQEALFATGVNVTHVPGGGKNSADRSLMFDLMYWVSQNPPPAHLFLISGDRDFAGILHKLRMNNYNTLLACRGTSPAVLCSAASIMWQWDILVRGENIVGKYFNQPPDGPFHSWYGHYKVALEDPFVSNEQPSSSQLASDSSDDEAIADSKSPTTPKIFFREIKRVVSSYPNGLLLRDLHSKLSKNGDYKKYCDGRFFDMLHSIPHICKLRRSRGRFFVHPVSPKASEPVENIANEKQGSASALSTTKKKPHSDPSIRDVLLSSPSIVDFDSNDVDKATDGKPPLPKNEIDKKDAWKPDQGSAPIDNLVSASASVGKNEAGPVTEAADMTSRVCLSNVVNDRDNKGDMIGEKTTGLWVNEDHNLTKEQLVEKGSSEVYVHHAAPVDGQESSPKMGFIRRLFIKLFGKIFSEKKSCEVRDDKFCDTAGAEKILNTEGSNGNISGPSITDSASCSSSGTESPGAKSLTQDSHAHLSTDQSGKELKTMDKSKVDGLFLMGSFWIDVQSFLWTKEGSRIILNSLTREEIAHNLKINGPLVTRSLEEKDLLHLVDVLISEKKLIEECPSQILPFRLVQPAASSSDSPGSKNTSHSSDSSSHLNSHQFPDQESKERSRNISCSVYPSNYIKKKKPREKSRNEIFTDCRNLMNELLKETPEGVNVGYFRLQFIKRHDYILDYRKHGFKDLTSLLKSVSGPNCVLSGMDKQTFIPLMDEEEECAQEELGPVELLNPRLGNSTSFGFNGLDRKYEFPWSDDDDDVSDFTEASCSSSPFKAEVKTKPRGNGENSSFVQLLDAWERSKATNDERTSSCRIGDDYENGMVSGGRKYRPSKSYSFVSDSDDSDNVIDGILGNFKKSGEPRVRSWGK